MITSRRCIVPASVPVVTLAEMREHLRIDAVGSPPSHPEDATIQLKLDAVVDDMCGDDGWLGRALRPASWRVSWDTFPCVTGKNRQASLYLPLPPLMAVTRVAYVNTTGSVVELVENTDYVVDLEGAPHGAISPLFSESWPATTRRVNRAVTVEFTCGYDETASPTNPIPTRIKQYVMVAAASMYENREESVANVQFGVVKQFMDAAATLAVPARYEYGT